MLPYKATRFKLHAIDIYVRGPTKHGTKIIKKKATKCLGVAINSYCSSSYVHKEPTIHFTRESSQGIIVRTCTTTKQNTSPTFVFTTPQIKREKRARVERLSEAMQHDEPHKPLLKVFLQ